VAARQGIKKVAWSSHVKKGKSLTWTGEQRKVKSSSRVEPSKGFLGKRESLIGMNASKSEEGNFEGLWLVLK